MKLPRLLTVAAVAVAAVMAATPMGVYAHTYSTLDFDRPKLPHLRAWYDRLRERSAYVETVMIPLT